MARAARFHVGPPETVHMETRDGVRLDADLYRPDSEDPHATFPVLLMRQPYGRRIASTVVFAHPAWYASHGYIVVIQDIRGRGTSDGAYRLFQNDVEDGADAVRWAATLPGADGTVAMYGFSYQGVTQMLAAAALLNESGTAQPLRALAPAMIGYGIHDDWVYEGGSFYLAPNIGWGIQMAAEEARLAGDEEAYLELRRGLGAVPPGDPIPARPALLERYASYGHYQDWVNQPAPGGYWDRISPAGRLQGLDVPVLHVGGWYDLMLPGTLAGYRELAGQASAPQALAIGPWTHMNWTGWHPAGRAGDAGESDIDLMLLAWFEHWMKGRPLPEEYAAPVRLYALGRDDWLDFDAFPDPATTTFFLGGDGRAALVSGSGRLQASPDEHAVSDPVVLDPWRPTPTTGGHADHPGGRVDRSETDARSDVLTFTSQPLGETATLAGIPVAELHCRCDLASFDLSVVLSEVMPDGRAINITESYVRVGPDDERAPARIELRPVAAEIAKGTALRLSVALASFPAHMMNTGDGTHSRDAHLMDVPITTVEVVHGGTGGSRVLLPLLEN
ncbi:MAG: CocE/NonD family hydrolase [Alphaproteobacteria bacterium]|nr:CocE/NonD family hydrolase [Alphaproteobacteria bacterium]